MIGKITGRLLERHPPQILIDVHGVGYEIDVPMSTLYQLPATGSEVTLYTHLTVREDAHLLYSFATEQERRVFRQLLKISGVGARTALSVLSGMSVSDLHGAVSLLTLLDPSRLSIPAYATYFETIQATCAEINARHGREGWLPIDLRIGDNFPVVIAAYQQYDVLLVNALADGMNLIAKEAPLLNETDGVVVLSERAGAYEELEPFVLGVDPLDIEATAAQLERAIDLPAADRAARSLGLKEFLRKHDVSRWIDLQLGDLDALTEARR